VQLASTIRAFDDCFRIATFAALIGVVPALFLPWKRKKVAGSQHEAIIEAG